MIKRLFSFVLPFFLGLLLLSCLVYLTGQVPVVFATDHYYVDAVNGSDITGDGTQLNPWQTISFALAQVVGPDAEVHVAPGTYNTALGESFPIVMEPAVKLLGAGMENTILYGDGVADVVHFPRTAYYTETTVISGFKITNGYYGVLLDGRTGTGSSPIIEQNWITANYIGVRNYAVNDQRIVANIWANKIDYNSNHGISLYAGYNGTRITSTIVDNEISHNGGAGIYCNARGSGSSGNSGNSRCNVTISGNLIANNSSDGFHCQSYYAGECKVTFSHNTFIDNNGWGVGRSHSGTYLITNRPLFINNIFLGNGTGGAQFRSGDLPRFVNNTVAYNGQYGIWNGTPTIVNSIVWGHFDDLNVDAQNVSYSNVGDGEYGGVNNNIAFDPQFTDLANDDLHLPGTSPLVNAGDSAALDIPLTDMDGDTRILGTAVDIGADETSTAYQVEIYKSVVPTSSVTIDEVLTYTLALINSGPASAGGVRVTDTLPISTTWDGFLSTSSGSAMVANGVLDWTGSLLSGITETIDFTVRVNPFTPLNSQITNTAEVVVPTGAITNSNMVSVPVGPGLYWQNSFQTVNHSERLAGQPLTYTIQVVNGGNIPATNVTVTDTLDPEAAFNSADNGGIHSSGTIVWSGLSVAVGETVTLTAVVTTSTPITPDYILVNQVALSGGGLYFQLPDVYTTLFNQVQAAFDATPRQGSAPLAVTFFNQSQYADSFLWDYGDGNSSNTAGNHVHLYQDSGIFTVTLTAANAVSSQTITHTRFITVFDAPVADFSALPTIGGVPLLVEFSNDSSYGEQFIWDYGDGITSTISSLTHTHLYTSAGAYDVSLTAINSNSSSIKTKDNYIEVYDTPLADFTGTPTEGIAPLAVTFSNLSTNATTYEWDFGDGQTSTSANPMKTYTSAGVYTVTLTASNPVFSDTLTRTAYITVYQPPTASFTGAPRIGFAPMAVTFTNFSMTANSFQWRYGDGSTSTNAAYTHQHIYDSPGLYTVVLTATNPYGNDTLSRINYIAVYSAPEPDFSATPVSGVEPLLVQFTNTSQNANSYLWTFGDGSTSTAVSPAHTYLDGGVYTVTLQATNLGGSVYLTRTNYITVHEAPEADFVGSPQLGYLNLTTTFTNTSLYADTYLWDYGDGSTSTTTQVVHDHLFDAPGIYDVSLTAINPYSSNTEVKTSYIIVWDTPLAAFTASPVIGAAPLNVTFSNQSQNANSYTWAFGDGTGSTATAPSHLYSTEGVYTVVLTATNPFASYTVTRTEYITVFNTPAAAFQALPRIGEVPLVVTFTNQTIYGDSFVWEYGDGQTSNTGDIQHAHTYNMPGTYTVTLTAVNPNGMDALTETHYIAVMEPTNLPAYHVDALYGSDSVGDGSRNNPWQTVTHAYSQVDQADVNIYVASGIYDVGLGEAFPIVMESAVRLIGAHNMATVLNGPGSGNVVQFTNAVPYTNTTLIQGFKITGGAAGVRIDGTNNVGQVPVVDGNWITGNTDGVRTYVYGTSRYIYATISNNRIDNNSRYGIFNDADSSNQSGRAYNNPFIVENYIANNGSDGIYCYAYGWSGIDRGYCLAQITGNYIISNGGSGVRAGAGYAGLNNIVLRENVIAFNQGWGLKRTEGPTEYWTITRPKLFNNLIYGNSLGGFNVHKEDEATLVNNTIVNNGPYGIKRESSGERTGFTHVDNSIVWGHTDNLNNIIVDWVTYSDLGDGEYSGTNNNVSIDPLFVDPAGYDFHLRYDSPVIDLADSGNADLPLIDIDGDPRLWGAGVDMGADEVVAVLAIDPELTANPDPVAAGSSLILTIAVTNTGNVALELTITDTLPAEVTPTGTIVWNASLNPGEGWQQQVVVTVQSDFSGQIINSVDFYDPAGLQVSENLPIFVVEPIAGLNATSNSPTLIGSSTQFTATITSGTQVSYTWDFGDGSFGSGSSPIHTYALTGTYQVVVTATNPVGLLSTSTTVQVVTPVSVAFDGTPTTGSAPLLVQFTNLSSGDFDTCLWDFGDGSSSNDCVDPIHIYQTAGTFAVTLTVSGPGGSDTETKNGFIVVESQSYKIFMPVVLNPS